MEVPEKSNEVESGDGVDVGKRSENDQEGGYRDNGQIGKGKGLAMEENIKKEGIGN